MQWPYVLAVFALSCEGQLQRLSPTSGGLCGGTRLSIYGSGFAKTTSANRVEVGGDECEVETVSDTVLVCKVPFRDATISTGKESAVATVTVHADEQPLTGNLKFTFEAGDTPIIVDWGPGTGQASDVLSFLGKNPMPGTSVLMSGLECKVKHSDGIYLQCLPPPREAGVSNIEVYFGPERGNACPGPKAPPLKFTYNLALQSALPSDDDGEAEGPLDGGGILLGPPCEHLRTPASGTLVVIGQGLGNSTVFKLCGGDTWCEREGPVELDPPLYHSGDWSFQKVTCRPGPLDPSKAPGGSRKCDLTAEGADGMFVASLPDVWTYTTPMTTPPPAAVAPAATPQQAPATVAQPKPIAPAAPAPAPTKVAPAPPWAPQAIVPLPLRAVPVPAPSLAPAPVPLQTVLLQSARIRRRGNHAHLAAVMAPTLRGGYRV